MPFTTLLALGFVVLFAFAVEAALGFGAGLVTLSVGALLVPLKTLLPSFIPLNVLLSGYVAARYYKQIDRVVLFRRVLPIVVLGMPVGVLATKFLPESALKVLLGMFIAALSALELRRLARGIPPQPASPWFRRFMLALGGMVHGAFGTGGPMIVYVTSFEIPDKSQFRATLSTLWLLLNLVLVGTYAYEGTLNTASWMLAIRLGLALAFGILLGEWLHRAVKESLFRRAVYVLLLCAGVLLIARNVAAALH